MISRSMLIEEDKVNNSNRNNKDAELTVISHLILKAINFKSEIKVLIII